MHFDLDKKPISALLKSGKQFTIPRFQREYSWDQPQVNEFFDDIIKQIKIVNNELFTTEYFWGTMLFVGSFVDNKNIEMAVVDGQQRITTMTMFLSALSKALMRNLNNDLAEKVWEYIIFVDNNLEEKAVLLNDTPNPYFQRLIQKKQERTNPLTPESEEEERIKSAYENFEKHLQEKKLREKFLYFSLDVNAFSYLDLLKIIRDQILSSITICMSTVEKKEAGMIFEILNAKGKSLDDLDLIKNKIFEVMKNETPTDEAKLHWKQTKENLASRGEFIDFSVFFQHYWVSKYRKVTSNKLYADFNRTIEKNENSYLMFLEEMEKESKEYIRIIIPYSNDYDNRQEFQYIPETLNNLNKSMNIKQHRIIMLGLNYARFNQKLIGAKMYRKLIKAIEYTHFVFNALLKQRTQWLDKLYSDFSMKMRNCVDKVEAQRLANDLIKDLSKELPSFSIFESKFIELQFSKSKNDCNEKCKFVVQTLAKFIGELDVTPNGSSVEHIMNENENNSITLSVGNLILLEATINSIIPSNVDFSRKKEYYNESKYPCIIDFLNLLKNTSVWTEDDINNRAKQLAHTFYYEIIGKILHIKT